jgi:EAL domain-containing protein (putative c-di-GMP-specific phosphodiesterase class I)
MFDNRADEKIVRLVIDLASSFDLGVVAEGVENEKTLKSLIAMGCHKAQGFYFARPMPQKEYIDWLDGYNPQQFFRD